MYIYITVHKNGCSSCKLPNKERVREKGRRGWRVPNVFNIRMTTETTEKEAGERINCTEKTVVDSTYTECDYHTYVMNSESSFRSVETPTTPPKSLQTL